jgi:hypothetical protein
MHLRRVLPAVAAACSGSVVEYQSLTGQRPGWYPTAGSKQARRRPVLRRAGCQPLP